MENNILDEILDCIIKDDCDKFSKLYENTFVKNVSFGRFPVLSLCYLYSSNKIINKYERNLIKEQKYNVQPEPFFVYKKFKEKAGKSLRLFLDEKSIITPLEMLAILHRDDKVKKHYKSFSSNETVKQNLFKIYGTFYGQNIAVIGNKIKISGRVLSFEERRNLNLSSLVVLAFVVLFALGILIATLSFGSGLLSPSKIYNQNQFLACLGTSDNFKLENDLTFDEKILAQNLSCNLDGQNHTIYIKSQMQQSFVFENVNGTVKNLNIVYQMDKDEYESSISKSFLCYKNSGTISNVKIDINTPNDTTLQIKQSKNTSSNHALCGYALVNLGSIISSTFSANLEITTKGSGDCTFAGFVSDNAGVVKGCKLLECSISTSEVDLSGIVVTNYVEGSVIDCENLATLSQTSSQKQWSPLVTGVASTNWGIVKNCKNSGSLSVNSIAEAELVEGFSNYSAFVGGVVAMNYNQIEDCASAGKLTVRSKNISVYAGGIVAMATSANNYVSSLQNCDAQCQIDVATETSTALANVGGFCGFLYGNLSNCNSSATFVVGADETKNFVGLAFGAIIYLQDFWGNVTQYINGDKNYVVTQENVEHQIGAMRYNNSLTSFIAGVETYNNSSGNQIVVTVTSVKTNAVGCKYE